MPSAAIAVTETVTWQKSHARPVRIVLVAYNTATFKAYQQALAVAAQAGPAFPSMDDPLPSFAR